MANPFEKYLENDLADFAGLRVSGTLPVKQEVLNELLQSVLTDLAVPKAATSAAKPATASPSVDPSRLVKFVKKAGMMPLGVEGEKEAEWVLVDLGDIVVHVMLPRIREFYGLERLWTVGDSAPTMQAANA